jgi:hypothetical protein
MPPTSHAQSVMVWFTPGDAWAPRQLPRPIITGQRSERSDPAKVIGMSAGLPTARLSPPLACWVHPAAAPAACADTVRVVEQRQRGCAAASYPTDVVIDVDAVTGSTSGAAG